MSMSNRHRQRPRSVRGWVRFGREHLRRRIVRALRLIEEPLGIHVVGRTIYSPIPRSFPENSHPTTELEGLELGLLSRLEWLESTLAPFIAEFSSPGGPAAGNAFDLWNSWYEGGEIELLYALVRHSKPARLLELGTGYSTLVSAAACATNAREGRPAEFVSIDPGSHLSLDPLPQGLTRLERCRAEDVPLGRFLELEAGDILFVDTTHTVKHGSEVNFLVLEVLPRLSPGVLVHFHDIFIPYDYPRAWFERGTYLSEQYLLQALLTGNPMFEVVFPAYAVARAYPDRLARAIPSLREPRPPGTSFGPSAFWFRRRSGPPPN
jgi:hypothetical protein